VWIKRKWLRALMIAPPALMLMTGTALVNPKEIEDLLHIMNETKIEFTIPEEGDDGDGKWPAIERVPRRVTSRRCPPTNENAQN
jgi:hypothetical protein